MKVISLLVSVVGIMAKTQAFSPLPDSLEMLEKLALFQDAAKAKQYHAAANYFHWILSHQPRQHVGTYILGADVLDELAQPEKSVTRKRTLVDSLLLIYDLRLQYCGDSANVINRKALASYRYNINGPNPGQVLKLMDEALRLNGNEIPDATLVPYMQAVVMTKVKEKTISEDEVQARYDKLSSIVDSKLKLAANDKKRIAKLNEHRNEIDGLLLKVIVVDCNFVHKNLEPKFKRNPDLALAKQIFGYLLNGKCDKDSLWLKTGEFIFSREQDFGLAKHLGLQFLVTENLPKARYYLETSLQYAPTASDSADVYVYLGSLYLQTHDKVTARAAYRNAIRVDPKHAEAFEKIGDLYYNSFQACAQEKSMADDRLTYLVAYDYYERAGNHEKMQLAKKYFPSREEIFLMNYHTGQTMPVGCWINESTILRTRD